ncbi:uncharacterized protein PHACADRAFT_31645 [Phanerochaete carnosa HHB-10118-sp]|uniref:Zn(2)-C6 fungal-type domain-containing protein n=1 Tax=Phanerochaete carnosa (strain HHB-10118-sp) TaxID=650164 RepID=K5VYH9_PHACS|nr:uncharacterized protein PHACADRAFT_31645 [Phanerochaete carnosa HHB-10118-sp]EKM51845.1 hypothetical protein PHACADRAFT_31645 [Phanerochaete carnosa HHB-10118-sp]
MDRGGGSGRGGPSRQGSSLPRTLHGSLLHTDPGEEGDGLTEEPQPLEAPEGGQEEQPPYTAYATSSARYVSAPHPPPPVPGPSTLPTFEQGSSRGLGEPPRAYTFSIETQAEHQQPPRARQERSLPLPPFRTQPASSTDPELYASSVGSSRLHSHYAPPAPPAPGRPSLPPVSTLDSALGSTSYAGGPSSQFYAPPRSNTWDTAPHLYIADRPLARTTWPYAALPEHSPPGRAYPAPQELPGYSEAARWGQYSRAENFAQEEGRSTAAHLSAARSTILESPQFPDPGRAARLYQPQPQVAIPPSQAPVPPPVELAQPFYEIGGPRDPYPQVAAEMSPPPSSAEESGSLAQRGSGTASTSAAPMGWQEAQWTEAAEQPVASTSSARRPSSTQLRKRRASERDDDSEEHSPVRRMPRKTPIACNFCRGRKLKCDGRTPTCSHCDKRRQPCVYVDAVRRRGPGRAPKGSRKGSQQQDDRAQSATQGPGQAGSSSSAASPPLAPNVPAEDPFGRYEGMYLSNPPAGGLPPAQAPPLGELPSRMAVQPPYPTAPFGFSYPPPREAGSGSRAAYERTTFSDDFGLPQQQQQLAYAAPGPGPGQVQAQAFEPPRVSRARQVPEAWAAMGSSGPGGGSEAGRRDNSDEDGHDGRRGGQGPGGER